MKIRISMVFIFLINLIQAQTNKPSNNDKQEETFNVVEEMPEPPGGIKEFYRFISESIKFPERVLQDSLFSGCKVFIKFVVDTSGNLTNPIVLKGCIGYPECDAESLRVISLSAKWKPGKQNNKAVNVYYTLPIGFRIK